MTERDDWGSFAPLRGKEAITARRRYAELMHAKTGPDYAGFLKEVTSRGINISNFSDSIETKTELLRQFFPGRYKTHHWSEMEPAQIGSLFNKIYSYSKKHC